MTWVFSFLAGLLTTLSPCVVPVLPFVTASSLKKNRLGPIFLSLGILGSFVGVSLLIGVSGTVLGIDPSVIRKIAGVFLFLSGLLFLSQKFADWFSLKFSFVANFGSQKAIDENSHSSAATEFLSGVFLGIVWTPCSGPSLGAALGLANQAGNIWRAGISLMIFGVGAIIPLLAFSYGTKHLISRLKAQSSAIGIAKKTFGILMTAFGFLIITGTDKPLEGFLTGLFPETWIQFITQF